jgi:gliding motility-associated-like protein
VLGTTLITVTDACGQVRNGAVDIVTCEVPNVFSPNGDGQNEFFEIQGIDAYPNSKLQVWNRWGVLVYESENYENFWSAEEQPDGVYYFILQRADGKIINGEVTVTR